MDKIQLLRELLMQFKVDSYIIPSTDEWQNEYTSNGRLAFISGFSGSNGVLVVTQKDLILYTDSRYTAQARVELSSDYTILDMYKPGNCSGMKACEGGVIGYDPMILTPRDIQYYEKLGLEYNFKLQAIDENLVDILMVNKSISVVEILSDDAASLCETIIGDLPQYFALPQENTKYIEGVKFNQNFAAKIVDKFCGMISVEYNYDGNCNIFWLGISPETDGIGVGTMLIKYVEKIAIQRGIKTLTVETLSPNEADENYLKTYNFYKKVGFRGVSRLKPDGYNHEMVYMVKSNLLCEPEKQYHTSEVMIMPNNIAGESVDKKFNRVLKFFPRNCDYVILSSPESICWLLNLRGKDIKYNTSILSYAIISRSEVNLFMNIATISQLSDDGILPIDNYNLGEILQIKDFTINIQPIDEFKQFLLENKDKNFAFDREKSSEWITQNLQYTQQLTDPTVKMRAVKNKTELDGIKLAHKIDGVAICKFWFWLYNSLKSGIKIDEISAADKLSKLRKESKFFLYESFATISAYGANAAVVHYHPKENTCKAIPSLGADYIYLLDSGGQYITAGTTDITRVFDIGKIFGINKDEHKRAYTLILKGHINLARVVFPAGTTGGQLDALARYNLWQNGMNYGHGTGHGVGHFLSVHEGPHAISGRNSMPLEENMVLSIEPGHYKEGAFGMRIENLYVVKKSANFQGFMEFELLTMVPIETSLIDFELLSKDEIDWLKRHNQNTIESIQDQLTREEVEFLSINLTIKN